MKVCLAWMQVTAAVVGEAAGSLSEGQLETFPRTFFLHLQLPVPSHSSTSLPSAFEAVLPGLRYIQLRGIATLVLVSLAKASSSSSLPSLY